jgi:hypothetical protein
LSNHFFLNKRTYILLILVLLLTSCQNRNANSEMYIGAYRSLDKIIPYPYIIEQKIDSIFLFNNRGVKLDGIKRKTIGENDTLHLAGHNFLVGYKDKKYFNTFDLNDTINFKIYDKFPIQKNQAHFEKLFPNKIGPLNNLTLSIEDDFWLHEVALYENGVPNYDLDKKQILKFDRDSLSILTNYFYQGQAMYSEFEKKGYSIFHIADYSFLSYNKEEGNPQPIFQIINFDSTNIELVDFSSGEIRTIRFTKMDKETIDYDAMSNHALIFSNCFDGFQGEYYYGNITYEMGNEFILNMVRLNAPENQIGSGYIIVHFNINCLGNIGNFGLIQMNNRYEAASFSKQLVGHLFNKLKNLKEWPSNYSKVDWLPYKDVHSFLMFKIENGKITDVLP